MTEYWLLFGFAALMALGYPMLAARSAAGQGQPAQLMIGYSAPQVMAFGGFVLAYFLLAFLRHETGGDWLTYDEMYIDIRQSSLDYALTRTDPVFGLILWLSGQGDLGVYPSNGICAWLLAYGVVRTAAPTRDPWLAILISVPYLLIVVGMGYVRQGGAIGLVLMAISTLDRARPLRTIVYLMLAAGFHSTAAIVFPLFGFALAQRHKAVALVLAALGSLALLAVIIPRMEMFELGYLEAEYDSQGTLVRLLMSVLPSALLLIRHRHFDMVGRARIIWLGIALLNLLALAAFVISPSSTAVDRIALYFSVIQIVVLGEIRTLLGVSEKLARFIRLCGVGVAAAVQVVFLVLGVHAEFWVPYTSVFSLL